MSGEFTSCTFDPVRASCGGIDARCRSSLTLFLCACLLHAGAAFAGSTIDKDGWTPIRFANGRVLLPITLNGVEGEAVIDSGSDISAIDEAFVSQHRGELKFGQPVLVKGVFGTQQKRMVNGAMIGMFGIEMPAPDLVPQNITPAWYCSGPASCGLSSFRSTTRRSACA